MDDELSRFIKAQQFDYERALHEIKREKRQRIGSGIFSRS